MAWIQARWTEYRKELGIRQDAPATELMHLDFDRWLARELELTERLAS